MLTFTIPPTESDGGCSWGCPFIDSNSQLCRVGWGANKSPGVDHPGPYCPGNGTYTVVRTGGIARGKKLYADDFFRVRVMYKTRAPIMCQGIVNIWKPKSVIDAGCALGDLVAQFQSMGIDAMGIERSPACLPYIQCPRWSLQLLDLGQPIVFGRRFDVCMSLEVAEHIRPENADVYLDNLCRLSDTIVMSACTYGKPNATHPNIQAAEYWEAKMSERGRLRNTKLEDRVRQEWYNIREKNAVQEALKNLMVYVTM